MFPSSRRYTTPRGVTLIEMLLALASAGLVGALLYSAHRTYAIRGQVAAGIEAAAKLEAPIAAAFARDSEVPHDRHAAGLHGLTSSRAGADYVESIDVVDGRIDVVYGNRADRAIAGRKLSLTPYGTATLDVVWVCGNEVPSLGIKPLGFLGGGRQAVQIATTIEDRYLPLTCR